MESFNELLAGFGVALDPMNILYVILGVVLGTVVGLLPGLGPTAGIAVLLPLTFSMEAESAIIMLAGIYYGSMYGGRIPAILLNMPGDSSSVVTTLDGYPMRQQGRAGEALGITAIGSFIGGMLAIMGLAFLAPAVASVALQISAPEMFLLALAGILIVSFLGTGSRLKALVMAGFGLLLGMVGVDPISGGERLTFGVLDLTSGLSIVPLAVGLFGFAEIFMRIDHGLQEGLKDTKLGRSLPTREDWKKSRMPVLRSSILGFFIGIIPGGGGTLSSMVAYGVQKRFSKNPEKFGKGAVDGLAATESADNASSNATFVPLLTLGLPPNPTLAVIFGALLIHNVTPGPQLIEEQPGVFWGVIASMFIGNIVLLILNLPLIRVFVQILRVRQSILFPIVMLTAICGVYSVNSSMFDVAVSVVFGIIGYLLKKYKYDPTPLVLAFVLGPIIESEFRRSMLMSGGSLDLFFSRPPSLGILIVLAAIIAFSVYGSVRSRRKKGSRELVDSLTP